MIDACREESAECVRLDVGGSLGRTQDLDNAVDGVACRRRLLGGISGHDEEQLQRLVDFRAEG